MENTTNRQLASIRRINDVQPIPNADAIEVVTVDGWHVVTKIDEGYKVGDLIVYIEIDSIVPSDAEWGQFLAERKYRVRTIKLRKQVSQGLVMPLSILPKKYQNAKEGTDVTDVLKIKKYDPEFEAEMKLAKNKKYNPFVKFLLKFEFFRKRILKGNARKPFPDWIVKTDETRIQNLTRVFNEERDNQTVFSVTEKLDGSSATYGLRKVGDDYEYVICSRNVLLDDSNSAHYGAMSEKYEIEKVLREIAVGLNANTVVIQGEIIGTGIQGNKYLLDGHDLYVFNLIVDGDTKPSSLMHTVVTGFNMKSVPILDDIVLPENIDALVKMAEGKSQLVKKQNREGLVIRNTEKKLSFKAINPKFLLEEK